MFKETSPNTQQIEVLLIEEKAFKKNNTILTVDLAQTGILFKGVSPFQLSRYKMLPTKAISSLLGTSDCKKQY